LLPRVGVEVHLPGIIHFGRGRRKPHKGVESRVIRPYMVIIGDLIVGRGRRKPQQLRLFVNLFCPEERLNLMHRRRNAMVRHGRQGNNGPVGWFACPCCGHLTLVRLCGGLRLFSPGGGRQGRQRLLGLRQVLLSWRRNQTSLSCGENRLVPEQRQNSVRTVLYSMNWRQTSLKWR